jgi:hypothetical protein
LNKNMQRRSFHFYWFSVCVLLAACASPTKTTTSGNASSGTQYSEDLSILRPKIDTPKSDTGVTSPTGTKNQTAYVEPKLTVNKQLDTVLDSIDRINLSKKSVEGFSIQVYSGKREEALNTKKQLASIMPNLESEVQFTEPIFRVKAGKYFNRMDAQQDFAQIKRYFPTAIIIPERLEFN